jgi:hypothetical protein
MKKLTNHTPGLRGVTLKPEGKASEHEIVWIEPGATIEVDPKRIVEPLPDLGDKPAAVDPGEAARIETLTAENGELKAQVAAQAKQIETLTADLEKATKPGK